MSEAEESRPPEKQSMLGWDVLYLLIAGFALAGAELLRVLGSVFGPEQGMPLAGNVALVVFGALVVSAAARVRITKALAVIALVPLAWELLLLALA